MANKYQKFNNYENENNEKINIADRELARAIQMGRISKNLTQEELNTKCNFPKNSL